MNCKLYQTEIEELSVAEKPSSEVLRHLETCPNCQTLHAEREKLQQILQNLQMVDAPANFNFRVKARLKQQAHPAAVRIWSWQRVIGLCAVTFAALIIGFVIVINNFTASNAPQFATDKNSLQNPAQSPTENLALAQATPLIQIPRNIAVTPPPSDEFAVRQTVNPQFAASKIKRNGMRRKLQPKTANNEIHSVDSPLGGVIENGLNAASPSIMPRGIPNPLEPQKKQAGDNLLRTVGIETKFGADGLEVVSINANGRAARSGLQTGDVIQKVNGENPAAISASGFNEINLTVRSNDKTKEIKISLKP